jgi:hypothetical protein
MALARCRIPRTAFLLLVFAGRGLEGEQEGISRSTATLPSLCGFAKYGPKCPFYGNWGVKVTLSCLLSRYLILKCIQTALVEREREREREKERERYGRGKVTEGVCGEKRGIQNRGF